MQIVNFKIKKHEGFTRQKFLLDRLFGKSETSRQKNLGGLAHQNFAKRNLGGFTLIELLVGMTIFTLILGAVIGILISGIRLQKRILKEQQALDQVSFAIEYMGRALRMVKREESDPLLCLSQKGLNYENTALNPGIKFINHLQGDDCQEFFLENEQLKYKKEGQTFNLTSADVKIENLRFNLQGESSTDTLQPRVTLFIEVSFPIKLELQTTISQRNLDI